VRVDDKASLSRLSTLIENNNMAEIEMLDSSTSVRPSEAFAKLPVAKTREKIKQLTGSDDALAFHLAMQAQAVWYLRPRYPPDQIITDNEGNIRAGTLQALVEKLTVDRMSKFLYKIPPKLSTQFFFIR
jgi:son of sevenless-like protein